MNNVNVNQEIERQIRPYMKRNMITSVADGAINSIAVGMIPLETILVYFISGYVKSSLFVGLLTTMQLLFMAIPQFFIARQLEGKGYYKRFMGTVVVVSRCQSLIIGLLILFVAPHNNQLFVILFYAVYWLSGFAIGATMITYSVFINKVILFEKRAKFFGLRGMFCSFGSIIGSLLSGFILRNGNPDTKYAYLFLLSFVIDLVSFTFIIAAFEPKVDTPVAHEKSKDFGKRIKAIMNKDKNLLGYTIAYACVMFAMSIISFQTLHAKNNLGLLSEQVSYMATIIFVFETLGYSIWGYVAHKYGFKMCTLVGSSFFIINLVIALLIQNAWIMMVLSAIYGLSISTRMIGGRNFVFSICSYDDRLAYLSIFNSLFIPVTAIAPLINGFLYDLLGFTWLCVINLAILCVGLLIMIKVKETVTMDQDMDATAELA